MPPKNGGKGEYFIGYTLTNDLYAAFSAAAPYGNTKSETALPTSAVKLAIVLDQWPLGDNNYPITPKMEITNNTTQTIAGGTTIEFDYPVSAPATMADQSGFGLKTTKAGYSGPNNIGGFKATTTTRRSACPPGNRWRQARR